MTSNSDDTGVYFPLPGNRMGSPEDMAEAFAGFPERIVELRTKRSGQGLSSEEEQELDLSEEVIRRSAPHLMPD